MQRTERRHDYVCQKQIYIHSLTHAPKFKLMFKISYDCMENDFWCKKTKTK